MPVHRHYLSLALLLMIGAGAILAASALVFAQDRSHMDHARHVHGGEATVPTMPGQEAFGTIQEIVRILEADPATDWSKVNIGALRGFVGRCLGDATPVCGLGLTAITAHGERSG